jgi:hypothetical protein
MILVTIRAYFGLHSPNSVHIFGHIRQIIGRMLSAERKTSPD